MYPNSRRNEAIYSRTIINPHLLEEDLSMLSLSSKGLKPKVQEVEDTTGQIKIFR
jgi:hypothetical protein